MRKKRRLARALAPIVVRIYLNIESNLFPCFRGLIYYYAKHFCRFYFCCAGPCILLGPGLPSLPIPLRGPFWAKRFIICRSSS